MSRGPRMTSQTQMVLRQVLVEPNREWYGLEVVQATGLPTGTVYPIITRLEQAGWITSRWETPAEQAEDRQPRPRRRYYRLTEDGVEITRLALAAAYANRATAPIPLGGLRPQIPGATG